MRSCSAWENLQFFTSFFWKRSSYIFFPSFWPDNYLGYLPFFSFWQEVFSFTIWCTFISSGMSVSITKYPIKSPFFIWYSFKYDSFKILTQSLFLHGPTICLNILTFEFYTNEYSIVFWQNNNSSVSMFSVSAILILELFWAKIVNIFFSYFLALSI